MREKGEVKDEEYDVEGIEGIKYEGGFRFVLLRWRGYPNPTWTSLRGANCPELVKLFEKYKEDILRTEIDPVRMDPPAPDFHGCYERIKLLSPVGGEAICLVYKDDQESWDSLKVWTDVIQLCVNTHDNIRTALMNAGKLELLSVKTEGDGESCKGEFAIKRHQSFEDFKEILTVYNSAAVTTAKLWKGASIPHAKEWSQDRCSEALLKIICATAFNDAIPSTKILNSHYQPFSSEVYGETRNEQVQCLIDQLNIKEGDVIIDLGSGIGNVVAYFAGGSKARKVVGIEKAQVPADCGKKLDAHFRKWMGWFKKKFRPFELHSGDFLDPQFRDLITKEATIVFINNYAFSPELEMRIKLELIQEMADGTRIVSTKPYGSKASRLTQRHMSDVTSILDIRELDTVAQPTSWTNNHVPYYEHTVNRIKLEKYFTEKSSSSSQSAVNSRRPSVSSGSSHGSREGSTMADAKKVEVAESDDDEDVRGPTTRKGWQKYTAEMEKKKRKGSPSTASPRWNEADREYMPPGMKKAKKEKKEKEPKKEKVEKTSKKGHKASSSSRAPRLSDDQRCGIEALHSMIVAQKPIENEGPGLVRVQVFPGEESPSHTDLRTVPSLPPGAEILNPADPIDHYYIEQRHAMRNYIMYMQSEELKQLIMEEIQQAQIYNAEMKGKVREKEQQVQYELQNGMALLDSRLKELGMPEVVTPSELLQSSKKIVAQHKDLTQSVSHLEAEVTVLQGKLRVGTPYGDVMLKNLHSLDESCGEDTKDKYATFIQRCAAEAGYPLPKFEPEADLMADIVLSPTGPRRRTKPRSGPGRKGKPEENNEEVERKVQEIVQVALLVDNQAKEKERRARAAGAPEKPQKKGASIPSSDPVGVPLPRTSFPLSSTPGFGGMQPGLSGRPDSLSLSNSDIYHNPSSTAGP